MRCRDPGETIVFAILDLGCRTFHPDKLSK